MKTQKIIISLSTTCLLCFSYPVISQDNTNNTNTSYSSIYPFGKGSNVISVGIGVGGSYTYIGDGYTSTPNFVLTYDNGTFGNVGPGTISLGALLAYKGVSYDYTDPFSGYYYDQSWSYFILGVRGAYHLNIPAAPRFDPYVGLMLGYYDISYKETSSDPEFNNPRSPYYYYYTNTYNSYVAFSLFIGARYYISNSFGLWLELGYGYSDAAVGVSFKF